MTILSRDEVERRLADFAWGTIGERQALSTALDLYTRLEQAFLKFHTENPRVYALLTKLARQAQGRGFDNYGIGALFEVARWQTNVETEEADGFKLNNNHRAYYARLIEEQEPDLAGFFRMRAVKGEK